MNGSGLPPQVVRVKQNDNLTRVFQITILRDEAPYGLDGSADITLRCGKPDGTVSEVAGTITNGSTVRFVLTDDITDRDGACLCDVCLRKDGGVLSSMPFYMIVSHSPNGRGA